MRIVETIGNHGLGWNMTITETTNQISFQSRFQHDVSGTVPWSFSTGYNPYLQ